MINFEVGGLVQEGTNPAHYTNVSKKMEEKWGKQNGKVNGFVIPSSYFTMTIFVTFLF